MKYLDIILFKYLDVFLIFSIFSIFTFLMITKNNIWNNKCKLKHIKYYFKDNNCFQYLG